MARRVLLGLLGFVMAFVDPSSSSAAVAFSRRAGLAPPQQLIEEPARIGAGAWLAFPNDRGVAVPTRFSWSHGTPVERVASTESGLFVASPDATPPSGFAVSVRLPSAAVVVRVFMGSAGSQGQLNATLLDSAGKQIGAASYLRPSGLSQTLTARFGAGAAAAPTALRVQWVQAPGVKGYNINFQAVAVQAASAAAPAPACAQALCTDVASCAAEPPAASNCTTVDLDVVGGLDWWHAGDSTLWPNPHPHPPPPPPKPPPPFPGPPECELPATLRKGLSRPQALQIPGPPSGADHASWMAAMRGWRVSCHDIAAIWVAFFSRCQRYRCRQAACRAALRLSGAVYEIEELQWTQTAYYQPLTMPYDRFFYNETAGN